MAVHAYCQGLLPTKCYTVSRQWRQRVKLVTDYVARKLSSQIKEYTFQSHLAAVTAANDSDILRDHLSKAAKTSKEIVDNLAPWVPAGPRSKKDTVAQHRAEYCKRFADPSSEKGKKAIEEQLRIWRLQRRGRRGKKSKRKLLR